MAAYPAVIELRVDGVTQVTRVLDTINKLDNALVSIKKTPLAIDSGKATDGIRVLKAEVDKFVNGLGTAKTRLASTTAGLNSQAQAFKLLAANTTIASTEFKKYTQAAEQARQKTSLKGGLAEIKALADLYKVGRTAPTQSFQGIEELLALGNKIPKNIASLELYRSELQRVFSLVDTGTKEFEELAAAIEILDVRLGKTVRGPTSPIGGRKDIPGSPAALKAGAEGASAASGKLMENLMLGAGFPLLFGGGPGQVLGGLAGSFVGPGFGGQILFSALGGQLEKLGVAAAQAGQALQRPIDNFSIIEQRALLASSSQERYVKNLIDSGQYIEATAAIQKRYNEVVGKSGSESLLQLTASSDRLTRAWAELNLQIQAGLAGPLAGFLDWVTRVVKGVSGPPEAQTTRDFMQQLTPEERKQYLTKSRELAKKFDQGKAAFEGTSPEQIKAIKKLQQEFRPGFGAPQAPAQGFRATEVQDTASVERRREIQAQITQLRQAELAAATAQLQQDVTILTKQQEFALSLNQQAALTDQIAAKKVESANLEYQQVQRTQQSEIINKQLALESAKAKAVAAIEEMKQLDSANKLTETKKAELQAVVDKVFVAEKDLQTTKAVAHVTTQRAQAERDGANALTELERRQQNVAAYAADAARQTEAFNRAANEATNALNNRAKVSDALTQAALTVNNIEIQSLQNKLAQAQTEGERLTILDNIRDLEVANAAITLQATRTQIQAEVERQRIAMSMAEVKYKELQAVVQLAAAQKVLTQSHLDALASQRSALNIARDNYATSINVANAQMQAADAVYRASVNAANLKANMEGTAAAAGAVAGAMDRVASASSGGGGGAGGQGLAVASFGAAGQNQAFMADYTNALNTLNKSLREFWPGVELSRRRITEFTLSWLSKAQAYNAAKTKQTLDAAREDWNNVVGPRALSNYLVDPREANVQNRQTAMERFGSMRSNQGESVMTPQVSITTGPVMQMDGTNYVTQRDLVSATGTAARQGAKMALEMLQNNPASRRSTGVTR